MDLHRSLLEAELAGELPELYALIFCAIIFPEFRDDYLDMAEIVVRTPQDIALVRRLRLLHR